MDRLRSLPIGPFDKFSTAPRLLLVNHDVAIFDLLTFRPDIFGNANTRFEAWIRCLDITCVSLYLLIADVV